MIIVAAHKAELAPFASKLGLQKKAVQSVSVYHSAQHAAFLCGGGREAVRRTLARVVEVFPDAAEKTWLNIGVAGQASRESTVGELVWAREVFCAQSQKRYSLFLPEKASLSQQVIVKTVAQPALLGEGNTDSLVMDMELAHIAAFLAGISHHKAPGIRLISAKLISDNRAEEALALTPEMARSLIAPRVNEILESI